MDVEKIRAFFQQSTVWHCVNVLIFPFYRKQSVTPLFYCIVRSLKALFLSLPTIAGIAILTVGRANNNTYTTVQYL